MASSEKTTLAMRLRLLRVASGLKQEEVADMLGIGRSSYTYYELARSKPDYDSLICLAKLFRVSIDYLVGLANFPVVETVSDDIAEGEKVDEIALGSLSEKERHLVCLYRQLSEDDQQDLIQQLKDKK